MKNTLKKIGFTAIIAVISLAVLLMTGCPDDDGSITSSSGIVLVSIPAGTFIMGSPVDERHSKTDEDRHVVKLSGFKMGKYEVTQGQYQAVMGKNPSLGISNPQAGETQDKRPVENVSWYDAIVFCNKLSIKEKLSPAYSISDSTDPDVWGTVPTDSNATWNAVKIVAGSNGYRLPTEAQWEYACRAGTTTPYYSDDIDDAGWFYYNSGEKDKGQKTHQVGKKSPNAWGLYDMHGNVSEWCWDRYDYYWEYVNVTQIDPMGASSGTYRVYRGGSYFNQISDLRSAARQAVGPTFMSSEMGFRLVR